ncbi:MAG: type IV pilus modification protein PilV [Thiothrix sp.]|nr:MAG: type IV pilus modification protein PilV [Thiothrix sp.]
MKITTLRKQRGAGLIEVLVSVVILAVGLTGIASMQVRSIRNNVSALEHSIAVIQAQSMADILTISRTKALAGAFNFAMDDNVPNDPHFVNNSVKQWRTSISNLLGTDAKGSINCVSATCTIVVQWNNSRATEGSATQQVRIEMQP